MDIEKQLFDRIKDAKVKVTVNELLEKDNIINILKDKEIELTFKEILELSIILKRDINL